MIHYPDSLSCVFNGVVRVDDQAEGKEQSAKEIACSEIAEESVASTSSPAKTSVISFRVSTAEKDRLQQMAGAWALGHYVRSQLFGEEVTAVPEKPHQKKRMPKTDMQSVAQLLGYLGDSEVVTGILALSLALEAGETDISQALLEKIAAACDDIRVMKTLLITALGVKAQEDIRS